MRWIWIDRFVAFESGKSATAVKSLSSAEDHFADHYPGFPVMPQSLIVEGMAQTGGILVGEHRKFKNPVVLAKVPKMAFHSWACPGDTLQYSVKLMDVNDQGGMVECRATVSDRLVAEGEIMFAYLPENTGANQENFVFSMRLLGVMDVGKAGDGQKLAGVG